MTFGEEIIEALSGFNDTLRRKPGGIVMPVGSQSSRKAAQRKTERSRKVSKAIGRAKGGLKNRRKRKVTW